MLILAGDVGGATTRLAYFESERGELQAVAEEHYPSREHSRLVDIVQLFVSRHRLEAERACFGVAAPVLEGCVRTPNRPWHVGGNELAQALGLPQVQLLNDLEANTYGIAALQQ